MAKETKLIRLDAELHAPARIEAIKDGVTLKKWLSKLIRQELNRRQETALDIKPLSSEVRTIPKI